MRAALLLWLLCQPTLAASQQKSVPKANPNQQQPQTDRRGTQDSPLVVKVLDPEEAKQRTAQVAQERDQKAATDRAITRATYGLLAVGIFQLALFLGQLWMMWRAESTAKRQLRAYVFLENAFISDPDSPKGVEVTVPVKNFGQTPAYNFVPLLHIRVADIPSQWEMEHDEPSPIGTQAALGPGTTFTIGRTLTAFTPEQKAGFVSGTKGLFMYGEIRYTDAFGRKRFTRFCLQFGGKYGARAGRLGVADLGNEAN